MSFDLGYDPAIINEPKLVKNMLKELDNAFDLVMISEMMDESLALLRQLMCWSTDDIVYLAKNARFDSRRKQLSTQERQLLEEFLALDMILYRHFAEQLARKIAAVPLPTFLAQSERLVARRLYFKQRCVTAEVNGGKLAGQQHEISTKIKGYQVSDGADWLCSRLVMAELGYTDLIREQQRQRLTIWRRVYDVLGLEQLDDNSPDGR